MSVGRICSRNVELVDANEDIRTTAARMRDRDVGILIVVDDAGRPIGVVSDRDLVIRSLAEGHSVAAPVRTVMTGNPCTIAEEAPIESALSLMAFGGVRRLPVVDRQGAAIGVIALDDVLSLISEEVELIGKVLSSQIPCQHPSIAAPRLESVKVPRTAKTSTPSPTSRPRIL